MSVLRIWHLETHLATSRKHMGAICEAFGRHLGGRLDVYGVHLGGGVCITNS